MSGGRERETLRLLRRLAGRGNALTVSADGAWRWRRAGRGRPPAPVDSALVAALLADGALRDVGGTLVLTPAGTARLRRGLAGDGEAAFAGQHQRRERAELREPDGPLRVTVNVEESPLGWLRRRRDAAGRPLVDAAEFEAGERLRADVTRGRMMARITANWDAAIASGRRSGGQGGMAELTEAALAARLRVERALTEIGPDFAGILLDFCCFLKGLEEIERERNWPARSAKLVLRLGLAALARHYGMVAVGRPTRGAVRHWGAEDYRPKAG